MFRFQTFDSGSTIVPLGSDFVDACGNLKVRS